MNKIVLINIAGGLLTLLYTGWIILLSWGKGFSSGGGGRSGPSILENFEVKIMIILGIGLILSIIFSHYYSDNKLVWSLLPIILIVVLAPLHSLVRHLESQRYFTELRLYDKEIDELVASIPKDYIYYENKTLQSYKGDKYPETLTVFITYDKVSKQLVKLRVKGQYGRSTIDGSEAIGKIEGKTLKVSFDYSSFVGENLGFNKEEYNLENYKDSHGKSISSIYDVVYVPSQDGEDYNLEHYQVQRKYIPFTNFIIETYFTRQKRYIFTEKWVL